MTGTARGAAADSLPRRLATLAAAGVLILAPAFGAEEKKPASDSEKPKVYTNKDLRKYQGMAPRPRAKVVDLTAKPPAEEKAPAPTMTAADKQQRIANLNQHLDAARARVSAIDQRARSLHNPFLPKPEVSEDERQAEAGMDARGILERIEAEKAALAAQIADLEAELEALEAAPTLPDPEAGGDAEAAENPPEPSSQEP